MKTWDQMTDEERKAERIRLDAAYVADRKRETDWLANLKVGDEVAVTGGWHPRFSKITRATPRYWIVEGNKYRKDNGYGVGGGFTRGRLCELTQDLRDDLLQRQLANELRDVSWSRRPLGLLKAVAELLKYEQQDVTGVTIRTNVPGGYGVHDLNGWDGRECKET